MWRAAESFNNMSHLCRAAVLFDNMWRAAVSFDNMSHLWRAAVSFWPSKKGTCLLGNTIYHTPVPLSVCLIRIRNNLSN